MTRRGQEVRIGAGRSNGNPPHGYRVVRQPGQDGELDRGRRAIGDAQAAIVRYMFERYVRVPARCRSPAPSMRTASRADALLSFAPGEACQYDWSHAVVLISGATVTVKVAHIRLCHSRILFVRAYPREAQAQAMVLDAHGRAFAFFVHPPARTTRHISDSGATGPGCCSLPTA